MRAWFADKKRSGKTDDYLKYQEGEVVPVQSKQPNYPPFLNDDDEEVPIKEFQDIVREEQKKMEKQQEKKSNPARSLSENLHLGGDTTPISSSSPNDSEENTGLFSSFSLSNLLNWSWLIVLGGLLYYTFPILQYFASQPPDLSPQVEQVVKQTLDQSTIIARKVTDEAKKQAEKLTEHLPDGKEILEGAKENLSAIQKESKPVSTPTLPPLPSKDWLTFLSNIHNEKQRSLVELQQLTSQFAKGEMTHSRYRLLVKGIANDISRLEKRVQEFWKDKDPASVKPVFDVVQIEIEALLEFSVSLHSISEHILISTFNAGVTEQNELTEEYKKVLKSVLHEHNIEYTEKNGSIHY